MIVANFHFRRFFRFSIGREPFLGGVYHKVVADFLDLKIRILCKSCLKTLIVGRLDQTNWILRRKSDLKISNLICMQTVESRIVFDVSRFHVEASTVQGTADFSIEVDS